MPPVSFGHCRRLIVHSNCCHGPGLVSSSMLQMADARRATFQPSGPIDPNRTAGVLFLPSRIEGMVDRLAELVEAKHNPLLHGFNQMVA